MSNVLTYRLPLSPKHCSTANTQPNIKKPHVEWEEEGKRAKNLLWRAGQGS